MTWTEVISGIEEGVVFRVAVKGESRAWGWGNGRILMWG